MSVAVPPEILARGTLAIEAYNSALREGKTCLKRLPVMLIGQDRTGKTSLKKSLRGERFNPQEESTIGINKDPSHFQVTTEIWKTGEKDEETNFDAATFYEHHAAKLIASSLMEEKETSNEEGLEPILSESHPLASVDELDEELPTSPMQYSSLLTSDCASKESQKEKEVAVEYVQPEGVSAASVDPSTPRQEVVSSFSETSSTNFRDSETSSVPGDNASSLSDEAEVPHDIATLVEKLLHEGAKVEDEDIYSVLWDFGGQLVYYVTHPLFLTLRAIYVLVHDLSRDPCEQANPPEKQGMFKTFKDQFCLKTNLDYLDFWMTSVASLACPRDDHEIHSDPKYEMLPEKLPPVFLVCSHADKPHGGMDPRRLANEIFDNLQKKPYSAHLVEHVFVVDNTLSGSESECPEVVQLRQDILAVASELPQMKEVIPVKWLKYERALQVAKKDGHKWISLESAKQIASEVFQIVDDQEFVTLLNFLHDQRIIIHFDDTPVLDKFLVLDPQWLINVFSKVITVQPYIYKERKYRELWCKFEETGILDQSLLEHVWAPLLDQQETSESLIAIMQKFSLLCPWPSSEASSVKQYLVPSVLMSHPPQDIPDLVASAKIPSLFLKFESGRVPPGFFPRLMLQFYQWGKDEVWSSLGHHFYHNFARFYTSGDQDCSVILLYHPSSIEVVVHRGNRCLQFAEDFQSKLNISADTHHDKFEVACASTVHRQLRLMLESMRKEFCWLENMRYEVGVICPVCCHGGAFKYCCTHHKQGCEHGECLHLLSESELRSASQFIVCTRSAAAVNNKVYVKQFAAWFGCPTEQVNSSQLKCFVNVCVRIMLYMYCNSCTSLSPKFVVTKKDSMHPISLIKGSCEATRE